MPIIHFAPTDDISMISIDNIDKSDNWKKFKEISHFRNKKYKDMELWEYSCERFYAIEMVMKLMNIKKALHIENDNLIYAKPDNDYYEAFCGKSLGFTTMTETFLSAGIMYIGDLKSLSRLNEKLNDLMARGENLLHKDYGNEMMHEMRLLKIIHDENPGLIKLLPILPSDESKYVYDPASWGQWVGGAYGQKEEPYYHNSHVIGRKINQKKYDVQWEKENGHKIPYVIDKTTWVDSLRLYRKKQPLYNLHIHSKNLARWC
jgi:hypothetical protein